MTFAEFQTKPRHYKGRFAETETGTEFRVWGKIDGEPFDRTFPSAIAWRAWRRLQRSEVEVHGMRSVEVA